MNNVAVTDGDKVEAEMRLGYHVDYVPFSDVLQYSDADNGSGHCDGDDCQDNQQATRNRDFVSLM